MAERPMLSWDKYSERVDLLDAGWFYRGHASASWPLETSLERHTPIGMKRVNAETKLLQEFKRRAPAYLSPNEVPETTGEWLALMQHFGAPTRLLDVTRSPYVALYFAVEQAKAAEPCAVWAINHGWCMEKVGAAVFSEGLFARDEIAAEEAAFAAAGADLSTEEKKESVFRVAAAMAAALIEKDEWLRISSNVVVHYEPRKLSERLSVQQGSFLVPRNLDLTFEENLKSMVGNDDTGVRKFVIDPAQRGRIFEKLRLMNITRASLFPGLEGYAQSFRQLLIEEPREARLGRMQRMYILHSLTSHSHADPPREGGGE